MSGIIPIFLIVFAFPFVLQGWGTLLCHMTLQKTTRANVSFWQRVILGFPVVGGLGYLINLALPISDTVSNLVWIAGLIAAFTWGRQSFISFFNNRSHLGIALFFAIALAILTRVENHLYDTGYYMYHFLWMKNARMFVGMAAMDINFGVNSIWFSICAIAWNSITGIGGAFVINTTLVLAFIMVLVEMVPFKKALSNSSFTLMEILTTLILLYFLLPTEMFFGRKIIFDTLGSPDTTGPATLYATLASIWFLNSFNSNQAKEMFGLFIAVCAISAVTIKMTYALLAALPFLWLFLERVSFRKVLPTISFVFVLALLFVTRSYALSGCFAFPALCTSWSPWAVGSAEAAHYSMVGKAYAIDPDGSPTEVLANWNWIHLWGVRLLRMTLTKTYLYFFVLGFLFYRFRYWFAHYGALGLRSVNLLPKEVEIAPIKGSAKQPEISLVLLCLAGLGLWFFTAPEIRYGYAYWTVGSITVLSIGLFWSGLHKAVSRFVLLFGVIGTLTFAFNPRMEKTLRLWAENPPFPRFPSIEILEGRTKTGVQYFYPKERDRCWVAPLTCITHRNDNFHLDLSGFYPLATIVK